MTRKEAIEKVRQWNLPKETREILEALIPELRESEDERIRRRLINLIKELAANKEAIHTGGYFVDGQDKKYIAYLEKQKEIPISAEEVLARAGLKPYKDGNQWCILAGDNIQEGICGFGDTIDEALYEFLKEVLIMANSPQLKEQKPAEWSEKDEKMREGLITRLNWITYNTRTNGTSPNITFFDEIDWLKSLRPQGSKDSLQTHWKPSEEQMKILEKAVAFFKTEWTGTKIKEVLNLESLYEQLKSIQ